MYYENSGTQDSSGTGSMLLMFCAGALAGAAAALVLAPASGREIRETIGRRGREFADDVVEKGKQVWNEQGERVASAVKQGYEQATSAMADKASGMTDSGKAM